MPVRGQQGQGQSKGKGKGKCTAAHCFLRFAVPKKNTPAEAGACPWRGAWAQYWALTVTPEKVL